MKKRSDSSEDTVVLFNHFSAAHVRALAEALGARKVQIEPGRWSVELSGEAVVCHVENDPGGGLAAYNLYLTLLQWVVGGRLVACTT